MRRLQIIKRESRRTTTLIYVVCRQAITTSVIALNDIN